MRRLSALVLGIALTTAGPAETQVADGAQRGDVAAVRALLKRGADVNAAQGDGMTALHWAALNGNVELAEMVIYAGANVHAVTRIGDYTPLHLASKAGNAPVVKALIVAGSNVAATTTTGGATPLHFAAASGSAQAVSVLLDHGADVNVRESVWGQTPLMFAAARDRVDVVKVLLKRGADLKIATKVVDLAAQAEADGEAAKRRDQVLAAYRTQQGPEGQGWRPGPTQVQAAVRAAVQTPQAATEQTAQRERALVAGRAELGPGADSTQRPSQAAAGTYQAGQAPQGGGGGGGGAPAEGAGAAYPKLVGSQGGLTALLHAVREGHAHTVQALLDAGADINKVSGDQTGPLLMAIINGHFDLALRLVEHGADPKIASEAGTTPLYAAINTHWAPKARYPQQQAYQQQRATYLDVMKALLKAGADPNVRLSKHLWYMSYTFDLLDVDTQGATPFWRAAYATDVEAMRLLMANGADANVPTMKPAGGGRRRRGGAEADPSGLPPIPEGGPGVWPLHAASGVGYGEGYAGNAHRHVPDGWLPAVKYLVEELGADVNARDHNGYTPLHHAAARGDNQLIRYLVEKGANVTAVSRRGQTTADMANGPVQRIQPFPEAVLLLEKLGSKNNHNCQSC